MSAPRETRGLARTRLLEERHASRVERIKAGTATPEDLAAEGFGLAARFQYAEHFGLAAAADMVVPERVCPGLPGHPPGACPHPPEQGDRYCAGCRAEWDAQPEDGGW